MIAFVCSLFLFSTIVLISLRFTIFNEEFMISQAKRADYYRLITDEINTEIEDLGLGSGISLGTLSDVVSVALVEKNFNSYIHGIYSDGEFVLEGEEEIKDRVVDTIFLYARDNAIEIDDESESAIRELGEMAAEYFSQYIELPLLSAYAQKAVQFASTLNILLILSIICFLGFSVSLIVVLKSWMHRLFRYMSYAFGGAGVMTATFPGFIYIRNIVEKIGVGSKGLYLFLTSYFNNFLLCFIFLGSVSILISVLCAVICENKRKRDLLALDRPRRIYWWTEEEQYFYF